MSNVAPQRVQAQGVVNFSTRVAGVVVAHVYGQEAAYSLLFKTGNTATETPAGTQTYAGSRLTGSGWSAQLWAANGAGQPESFLVPVQGSTTSFRTGATLGGTPPPQWVAVPGVPIGGSGTFQVRVWNNYGGTVDSYDAALSKGKSDLFTVSNLVDGLNPNPPDMVNFRSFNLSGVEPITILTQPQSLTILAGQNATFTVSAQSTYVIPLYIPKYQWRFNGTNIASATNSDYTVVNAQPVNAGAYSVLLTNYASSATSSNAVLTVNVPPTIYSAVLGGNLVLTWSNATSLQTSENVEGPYLAVLGATSPFTNNLPPSSKRFFRLRQ